MHRMTDIELTPKSIEAIADRVAELLTDRLEEPGLIDAAELALRLGVTRSWVYEHAAELGALKLGGGERARLRFDPERALAALASRYQQPPPQPVHRHSRPHPVRVPVPLLPIRGRP